MSDTCVTCGQPSVLVYELDGNPIRIDPLPCDDGELVLRGDPLDIPVGEFVLALYGVADDGDAASGIPSGAPRYRQHVCNH